MTLSNAVSLSVCPSVTRYQCESIIKKINTAR